MREAEDVIHTFLQQLVVLNDVFIGDANDPDVELDEYACDWDTCGGGGECGDVAIASSCDAQLKCRRARKRRSGKQGKQTFQRLHVEEKCGVVSCDMACHVLVSTPELRLRNTGVG